MPTTTKKRFGPAVFVLSLIGLGILPMLPEMALFFQSHSDFKGYKTIWYYEFIVSFLLLAPSVLLPRMLSRVWVILYGFFVLPATVIIGFYSATNGERWNLTAHTALFETNRSEAVGYLRTFFTFDRVAWVGFIAVVFIGLLVVNIRAARPAIQKSLWAVAACLLLSAQGIRLAYLYAKTPFRATTSDAIPMFGTGYITMHPALFFWGIHYNYVSSRQYYLHQYREAASHFPELEGAQSIPGAVSPRVGVVVVGESANRNHLSLYGYRRDTTPGMRALGPELFVFSDVISSTVGTTTSIREMLTTPKDAIPVFHLFSGAGYRTHWISTRNDNGDEIQLAVMVESCDDLVYLSGGYDESLVPFVAKALDMPGKQLIFLNLTGSHVRYSDDYPVRQTVFSGSDGISQFVATYDNSIHYTDFVLSEVLQELKKRNEPSFLLYFSDHGEDVYDSRPDKYLFRDDTLPTDPMVEVPFFLWFSPAYIAGNRKFVTESVAGARNKPFQNQELYHSLMSLTRLSHPLYDASKDLFSPGYVARERRVGAAARIYDRR